jgi:hypothetical protein
MSNTTTFQEATYNTFGKTPSTPEYGSDPDFGKCLVNNAMIFIVKDKKDLDNMTNNMTNHIIGSHTQLYVDQDSDVYPDLVNFLRKQFGKYFKVNYTSFILYGANGNFLGISNLTANDNKTETMYVNY